jgi:hypothetical protein
MKLDLQSMLDACEIWQWFCWKPKNSHSDCNDELASVIICQGMHHETLTSPAGVAFAVRALHSKLAKSRLA